MVAMIAGLVVETAQSTESISYIIIERTDRLHGQRMFINNNFTL